MDNDIVPNLLKSIEEEFDEQAIKSTILKNGLLNLRNKSADYADVNKFAIETGKILANVLKVKISPEILPDEKMYYNIAERILNPTLKKNYELISNYAVDVQTEMNHAAKLKIRGQRAEINQDRIDGLINKISNESEFKKVAWVIDEPIINFSQSVVDDTIKVNAAFHAKSGLKPKIIRRISGHKPCKWCLSLAGSYDFDSAPEDVYRRHERCRCTVEYQPGDGRKQDVWSKQWENPDRLNKIAERSAIQQTKVLKNDTFDKTNMREKVGVKNYNDFIEKLEGLEETRIKDLINKLGSEIEFKEMSENKDIVNGSKIQLSSKAFSGTKHKVPLQTVFHEFGHGIDNIAIHALDSDFDRVSAIPSYKLKNDIKIDLLNLINKDLSEINGENYQQIKNMKKMSIFDQGAIVRKYKGLYDENPAAYSGLSDLLESTGAFIEAPLGTGHGLKYWKAYGMQEAEFFAHMTETVVNPEARKVMYELFPTAAKKWDKMIDDMLKKVD